jgi:pseudouridine synthase
MRLDCEQHHVDLGGCREFVLFHMAANNNRRWKGRILRDRPRGKALVAVRPRLQSLRSGMTQIQRLVLLVILLCGTSRIQGFQERTVVLLYNKPANVVTTHALDDIKGRRNVYQEIYSMQGKVDADLTAESTPLAGGVTHFETLTGIRSRLHAVGRLDADTTGALLLTNDGALVHHVTNRDAAGAHVVSKTYEAVVMGCHGNDSDVFRQMREDGIHIGEKYGGWTRPVDDLYVMEHPTEKSTRVSLTISEGKNRQIRRMFHAVGSGVMKLKRTRIGDGLDLEDLTEGQWRILSDDEVRSTLAYTPRFLDSQRSDRGTFSAPANIKKLSARRRPSRRKTRRSR